MSSSFPSTSFSLLSVFSHSDGRNPTLLHRGALLNHIFAFPMLRRIRILPSVALSFFFTSRSSFSNRLLHLRGYWPHGSPTPQHSSFASAVPRQLLCIAVRFSTFAVSSLLGSRYYSVQNQFERFRWFWELFSRFEFEFCRCENYIF